MVSHSELFTALRCPLKRAAFTTCGITKRQRCTAGLLPVLREPTVATCTCISDAFMRGGIRALNDCTCFEMTKTAVNFDITKTRADQHAARQCLCRYENTIQLAIISLSVM